MNQRANPFDGDDALADFAPKAPAQRQRAVDPRVIDDVAQTTGFVSRAASAPAPARRTRRYTTGRNQQINIKLRRDVHERFLAIVDKENVPQGEMFERMLINFEQSLRNQAGGAPAVSDKGQN